MYMFERATKEKLRFPHNGMISVEALWDVDVTELDSIFKQLNSQLRIAQEESLLDIISSEDELLRVKIEIVKHIVTVKLAEAKDRSFFRRFFRSFRSAWRSHRSKGADR